MIYFNADKVHSLDVQLEKEAHKALEDLLSRAGMVLQTDNLTTTADTQGKHCNNLMKWQ